MNLSRPFPVKHIVIAAALCLAPLGPDQTVSAGKPPSGPPPVPVRYSIVFLNSLGGENRAFGMNDYGDVVGRTILPGDDVVFLLVDGAMIDLGALVDPALNVRLATVHDVSNSGMVAGAAHRFDADGVYLETFIYRLSPDGNGDGYVEIEQIGGSTSDRSEPYSVYGINTSGDLCGAVSTAAGYDAFLYTDEAGFKTLGPLNGSTQSIAYALTDRVNGQLQVAGTSGDRGFRYVGDASGNGSLQNLGSLWTSNSQRDDSAAFDINQAGDVAGFTQVSRSDSFAARYRNGKWTSLGTLSTNTSWDDSEASAINDAGHVVGFSFFASAPQQRSFLYVDGYKLTQLESLIDGLPSDYVGQMELIEIANPAPGYQYGVICGRRKSDWSSFLLMPDR